jgi:hypothetical protein
MSTSLTVQAFGGVGTKPAISFAGTYASAKNNEPCSTIPVEENEVIWADGSTTPITISGTSIGMELSSSSIRCGEPSSEATLFTGELVNGDIHWCDDDVWTRQEKRGLFELLLTDRLRIADALRDYYQKEMAREIALGLTVDEASQGALGDVPPYRTRAGYDAADLSLVMTAAEVASTLKGNLNELDEATQLRRRLWAAEEQRKKTEEENSRLQATVEDLTRKVLFQGMLLGDLPSSWPRLQEMRGCQELGLQADASLPIPLPGEQPEQKGDLWGLLVKTEAEWNHLKMLIGGRAGASAIDRRPSKQLASFAPDDTLAKAPGPAKLAEYLPGPAPSPGRELVAPLGEPAGEPSPGVHIQEFTFEAAS